MNTIHIGTRQEIIATYMPTEKRSKEANIFIFREIPEKTGGKIRQMLATTSADTTVRLWPLSDLTAEPRVLRGHTEAVYGVTFSPDGQVLATTSADKTARLWSLGIDDLIRRSQAID